MKPSNIYKTGLPDGGEEVIERFYMEYRNSFISFFRKWGLSADELLDIYQDSIIILYQAINMKKINTERTSFKTYLFGIGKNRIKKYYTDKAKMKEVSTIVDNVEIEFHEEYSEEQKALAFHFEKLGKSCQNILSMFYYRGLSISEIVTLTNYKDAATVKSQKSRCLKNLRERMNK